MHAAFPTHFILLEFIILVLLDEERIYENPQFFQFSPATFGFLRFSSKYSPLSPVLKEPQFVLPLI
jgi:hypothetical protein